eukprot:287199-Chlamydomonas_euryale.AAC.1
MKYCSYQIEFTCGIRALRAHVGEETFTGLRRGRVGPSPSRRPRRRGSKSTIEYGERAVSRPIHEEQLAEIGRVSIRGYPGDERDVLSTPALRPSHTSGVARATSAMKRDLL